VRYVHILRMIAEVFLEKENVLEKQRQDIIKILLM